MAWAFSIYCLPGFNPNQCVVPTKPVPKAVLSPRSFKTRHVHSAVTMQVSASHRQITSHHERRSANYEPTSWSSDFLQSLKNEHADIIYKDKAKKLEQQIRCAINDAGWSLNLLELIDDIQRLGLGHRFEMDIKSTLDKIFSSEERVVFPAENSLHSTALCFRLLRQHGYEVSQEVFKTFKDHKGNFIDSLCKDVKGVLSLFEASHLAFEGEDLMDEALTFTRTQLKDLDSKEDKVLLEQVSHALKLPLHHRFLRLEARWYIEAYGKKADANPPLLELAKLDFNMVQSTFQDDLQDMSRWWTNLGLARKLKFARDRLMEYFFWSIGMVSEPQFSNCRKGMTKVMAFILTIDDVYDIYGTADELELFTDAIQRWDVSAVKDLPDYMKVCFLALYNFVNEMAYDTLRDHGEIILPYLTKAWADLCKAFQQEVKWSHSMHTPKFQDYLENACVSSSGLLQLVHVYFLLSPNITNDALESLEKYHDLLHWPSLIFRLCNDLATSKAELGRGESTNAITCYMKENGCSEEVACQHISDLIEKSWKKMNKISRIDGSPFAKHFVEAAINLARTSQCTYQHGDGFGCPDNGSKNKVVSVLIEPISLVEKATS